MNISISTQCLSSKSSRMKFTLFSLQRTHFCKCVSVSVSIYTGHKAGATPHSVVINKPENWLKVCRECVR